MRNLAVPVHSVPRSHKEIQDRLPFVTASGVEGALMVVKPLDNTTNENAKLLMKKKVLAAAEARQKGVPLGVDLRVGLGEADRDRITLRIQDGRNFVLIPVEPLDSGGYKAMNGIYPDLRKMTVGIMEKYEMHQSAKHVARLDRPETPAYQGMGMR
jgi:hypothetical protein